MTQTDATAREKTPSPSRSIAGFNARDAVSAG
jgi:hypothetical protein